MKNRIEFSTVEWNSFKGLWVVRHSSTGAYYLPTKDIDESFMWMIGGVMYRKFRWLLQENTGFPASLKHKIHNILYYYDPCENCIYSTGKECLPCTVNPLGYGERCSDFSPK